jgi:NADH pyrophosphatase NudC (nudix superfamily)
MAGIEIMPCTVSLLRRDGKVLLGRKTKKVGAGLFNGPGGVIESGEGATEATIREDNEEVGVTMESWAVLPVAIINCYNWQNDRSFKIVRLYVSQTLLFEGEPQDGDELKDLWWFSTRLLPLGAMLPGDRFWLPYALSGMHFFADIFYEPDMKALRRPPIIAPASVEDINRSWHAL